MRAEPRAASPGRRPGNRRWEGRSADAVDQHAAVLAHRRMRPDSPAIASIETLASKRKSAVYRLRCGDPGAGSIIAKRCCASTGSIERAIYEKVLPDLALTSIRCLGCAASRDPAYMWIFLEDAGDRQYSRSLPEHRILAAEWIGRLHLEASALEDPSPLPECGPARYLRHLIGAKAVIERILGESLLGEWGRSALERTHRSLDAAEMSWSQVQAICARGPRTLVHGDLKEKNLRVRGSEGGVTLFVLDWEEAGWGVPAVDVAKCPEPALYGRIVRRRWRSLSEARLRRLGEAGVVFRSLASIDWEMSKVASQPAEAVDWSIDRLMTYRGRLEGALARIGSR